MSWFDAGALSKYSSYAKTALKQAQKNIDKVLDIKDEVGAGTSSHETVNRATTLASTTTQGRISPSPATGNKPDDAFFDTFLGAGSPDKKNASSSSIPAKSTSSPSLSPSSLPPKTNKQISHLESTSLLTQTNTSQGHCEAENSKLASEVKNNFTQKSLEISLVDEPFMTPNTSLDGKVIEETLITATTAHDNTSHSKEDEHNDKQNDQDSPRSKVDENTRKVSESTSTVHRITSNVDIWNATTEDVCMENTDLKYNINDDNINRDCNEDNDVVAANLKLPSSNHVIVCNDLDLVSSEGPPDNCEFDDNLLPSLGLDKQVVDEEIVKACLDNQENADGELNSNDISHKLFEQNKEPPKLDNSLVDVNQLKSESSTIANIVSKGNATDVDSISDEEQFLSADVDTSLSRCNKDSGDGSDQEKEIRRLQDLVNAREEKLVQMSKENISLQESIAVYRNQLTQLESVKQTEETEVEEMRKEFMERIGESDRKLQTVMKERDKLKDNFQAFQEQMSNSADEQISALSRSLTEKEEKIKDLLTEGEMLSKKEFEANTRIKKFRVKLKDVTSKNEANMKKVEEQEAEIESLKNTLKEREAHVKKIEGEVKKLESITDSQEDEISALRDKFDDREEKYKAMETTLQNTYMEINQLNLEKAQKTTEAQEATAAAAEKEELQQKLKELQKKAKFGKEELLEQLEDLQTEYSRLEQQSARREENLKREIRDLQKRIEEGESRNQELSQSVTGVTKPLLRQIENLQATYSSQADNWEAVEKSLLERIGNIQQELLLATEKERSAAEIALESKSKAKVLEKQLKSMKDEKRKLEAAVEEEKNGRKETLDAWKKNKLAAEKQVTKYKELYDGVQKEKVFVEDQLSATKVQYDNDVLQLHARLSQQQQQQQQHDNTSSRRSSVSSSVHEENEMFTSDSTPQLQRSRSLLSTSSIHDSILGNESSMSTATTASLEQMQRAIRKRDGEVYVLKEEIKTLEKTKASLAQELVNLSNRLEESENSSVQLQDLQNKHQELESRYGAVLQMYGEKAEEAEELKMDLQDIKTMYKQQIQDLLGAS